MTRDKSWGAERPAEGTVLNSIHIRYRGSAARSPSPHTHCGTALRHELCRTPRGVCAQAVQRAAPQAPRCSSVPSLGLAQVDHLDRGLGPSDVCRVLVHTIARVLPVTRCSQMQSDAISRAPGRYEMQSDAIRCNQSRTCPLRWWSGWKPCFRQRCSSRRPGGSGCESRKTPCRGVREGERTMATASSSMLW